MLKVMAHELRAVIVAELAFRLPYEGEGGFGPEEADLVLKVMAHELRAVIVAELESGGNFGPEFAQVLVDGLADRLEGFEACGSLDDSDPDALGHTVVDGSEHGEMSARDRPCSHRIDAPHRVRPLVAIVPRYIFFSPGKPDIRSASCIRWRTRIFDVRTPSNRRRPRSCNALPPGMERPRSTCRSAR